MVLSGKLWRNIIRLVIFMLRGLHVVSIDPKNRIVLPSKIRSRFEGGSIITVDTEEPCLLMYPIAIWEEIELKLVELPSFNNMARRIQRLLIGHATELELDSQGRILLPPALREYAALNKHAVLVGQGKKLEIWAENVWQERREKWLSQELSANDKLPEVIEVLSL